mmetsp:Transcript_33050/g.82117  ORF Transcript_33050/g.82117 Transcript_33050/m.82117 type:complete len:253 (-) Transcript_33050:223-981(-)
MAMVALRAVLVFCVLQCVLGFAPPPSRLLAVVAPACSAPACAARTAVRMNIFENALAGAAKAVGQGVNKMTGMPDLSPEEQAAMEKAMLEGTLNFDMFMIQMSVVTKAGSLASIASKIPGMGDKIDPRTAKFAEEKMKRYAGFCTHMTPEERLDPSLLLPGGPNAPIRIARIASAAGVYVPDVNQFLSEFVVMRKTSQAMAQGKSPSEIEAVMKASQDGLGMINRTERRAAAKDKTKKSKSSKGFGAAGTKA